MPKENDLFYLSIGNIHSDICGSVKPLFDNLSENMKAIFGETTISIEKDYQAVLRDIKKHNVSTFFAKLTERGNIKITISITLMNTTK